MLKCEKEEGIFMINLNYLKSALMIFVCAGVFTTSTICVEQVFAQTNSAAQVQTQTLTVKPLDIVNSPKAYLNKNIVMNAKFDKFSTLGLDYK